MKKLALLLTFALMGGNLYGATGWLRNAASIPIEVYWIVGPKWVPISSGAQDPTGRGQEFSASVTEAEKPFLKPDETTPLITTDN